MHLFSAQNLAKYYNDVVVFRNVSWGMESEDKVALVGLNGCGKSTLLNMIIGEVTADEGEIARNRDLKIGYLPQTPTYKKDEKIVDHIFTGNDPRVVTIKQYEEACISGSDDLEALSEKMDRLDAWNYENDIKAILDRLVIVDLTQKMSTLSGGMLKKVALARMLIADSNLLILDEPTNHLDLDTIIWLQKYLATVKKGVLMVTHDRYFLDAICTSIYEIEHSELFQYKGNYSFYLRKQQEHQHSEEMNKRRVQTILRRELAWLSRGARARTTKSKERINKIDTMRSMEWNEEDENFELAITGARMGKKILEVENLSKIYDGVSIVSDFSYTFKRGEKLGIVGPNGSGKSTLLDLISASVKPDGGELDKGINTVVAYFDQTSRNLPEDMRLLDYVRSSGEVISLKDGDVLTASKMLERFLFPSGMHYTPIAKLSGGERRRLYLLKVLMTNPNFIILDEPTNDLDIKTLSILEDFLRHFEGNLLVVSHDRYFMDRTVDHLLVFDEQHKITRYSGFVSEWIESFKDAKKIKEPKKQPPKVVEQKIAPTEKKLGYKDKRELEQIEQEIPKLEEEVSKIEQLMNGAATSPEKLVELGQRHREASELLDKNIERWTILEEKKGL